MNRWHAWVMGAAIGLAAAGGAPGVSMAAHLALFDKLQAHDIVWGRESGDGRRVGVMDPPYFTPDPDRVEVLVFSSYAHPTWQRSEPLTRAWRESLPDGVVVRRMPMGVGWNRTHYLREHWKMHQRVYFAGQMLGIEDRVHEAMASMIEGHPLALGFDWQVAGLANAVGIAPEVFARWVDDPRVAARVRMASVANTDRIRADRARGAPGNRMALYPEFLINGRYAVSGTWVGDPGKTYRIANRVIREELERGRSHEGPTNDEEFTEWMAPREGEIFRRVRFGRTLTLGSVYSHARRELWQIGDAGEVVRTGRLVGTGDAAYFSADVEGNGPRHGHPWRLARQYVSFEGEGGPQRYGAFLLTDWLSAPDTLWVGLPFKGREVAFAFTPDGKVEARNEKGSMFGTWWLEAGNLNVSFGALGIQSWPWREAAAHVGFEVPQRSMTPWVPKKKKKKRWIETAGDGR